MSTQTIASGSSISGSAVTSGNTLQIASGGTMISMTIENAASATVAFGGTDIGTTILAGGYETLSGTATGDAIYGTQLISFGGAAAIGETVFSGGAIDLFLKSGSVDSTTVMSGGTLAISGNASATDTTLSAGALLDLQSPKANVDGTLTLDGPATIEVDVATDAGYGDLAVISGFGSGSIIDERGVGSAGTLSTVISGGSTVATIDGSSATETLIFAGSVTSLGLLADGLGGIALVYGSGTSSISATTSSGSTASTVIVSGGSSSSGVLISSGGTLLVESGGTAIRATIGSGGTALVAGIDSGSVLNSGAFENVSGQAYGDDVYGTQLVSNGTAKVFDETVFSGGTVELFLKGVTAQDMTILGGGTLAINGNVQVADTLLDQGGLLDLQSPKATLTGALTFDGPATLQFDGLASAGYGDQAILSGFGTGDVVDERGIGSGGTLILTASGGDTTATITSGGTSETLTFAGAYTSSLTLGPDNAGGVEITYVPCFAAGTRIRTPRGEVAVEALAEGDLVLTREDEALPVTWIGQRTIDCARHARPAQVAPICIQAQAFGPGLPVRDLLLSPDHGVFAEGVLIPIKHLINGSTIRRIGVPTITYFHVELPRHAIILAEGLPAESYLDSGDRAGFANGGGGITLHPAWGSEARDITLLWEARGAAPLCVSGAQIDRVRAALAAQAAVLNDEAATHRAEAV